MSLSHAVGNEEILEKNDENASYRVMDLYFESKGLVSQQLSSYNNFVSYSLQDIVDTYPEVVIVPTHRNISDLSVHIIKFHQIVLFRPVMDHSDGRRQVPLYPSIARIRNNSYNLRCTVNITHEEWCIDDLKFNKDYTADNIRESGTSLNETTYNEIHIGDIPLMVQSDKCYLSKSSNKNDSPHGECHYDEGGYFIVNGMEKCLISQERLANNVLYVFCKSAREWTCEIRSQRAGYQSASLCAVKLKQKVKDRSGINLYVDIPGVKSEIPLPILMRALGCIHDKSIVEKVLQGKQDKRWFAVLKKSIQNSAFFPLPDTCLDYIGRRCGTVGENREGRIAAAKKALTFDFLAHCGTTEADLESKSWFVGLMTVKLLKAYFGVIPIDDRDSLINKRVDSAGALLANSFGSLFRKMCKDFRKTLQNNIDNGKIFDVCNAIRQCSQISSSLKYQMATGNWMRATDGTFARTGVSQVLNRLTYMSALSHLRRLNTPIGRDGKMAKPRQLHNTTWGYICPCETPEGQAVGLVKNLSLVSHISVGMTPKVLADMVLEFGVENLGELNPTTISGKYKVFVGGSWIGCIDDGPDMWHGLRELRRTEQIPWELGLILDHTCRELHILTDSGRIMRPLFSVENNKLVLTKEILDEAEKQNELHKLDPSDEISGWMYLMSNRCIDVLDCREEESSLIAMFPRDLKHKRAYSHCEIHPMLILGVCASIIPFPDHNQSPRNVYQSAMGKQAMGLYATNYQLRMDTSSNVLHYPQKPLVSTQAMKYLHFTSLPAGVNVVVAIMTYTGYNQEDSLILSQSAIDRGLFRSMFLRCYSAEEKFVGTTKVLQIKRPDPMCTSEMRRGDYSKLDLDGVVEPGCRLTGDDVIVGRIMPKDNTGNVTLGSHQEKPFSDCSITVRTSESGAVDQVVISSRSNDCQLVKIRLRSLRIPQIGDKFASRHGQKGTIGLVLGQEDLPFTRDGISPDLIMNPHAIPSRMTIGHLFECLEGKGSAILGHAGNGTAFSHKSVSEISQLMHNSGNQIHGNERMYSGFTGEMGSLAFIGPTYYQRLKHMVDDKIHSRSTGPVTMMTRQPTEGRSKDGGLRFGEMERDCMISHGAASILRERLFLLSDPYSVHICDICGTICTANPERQLFSCHICSNKSQISLVHMPYACKLLLQELKALHILPRLVLHDN